MLGLDKVALIAGAISGAVLAGMVAIPVSYHLGKHDGRQEGREAALQQSITNLKRKAKTDAEIRSMSDADLCRAFGGIVSDDGDCL